MTIERKAELIRDRLILKGGYKEDEIKTLFKTDEDLVKFYDEVVKTLDRSNIEEDEDAWDEDAGEELTPKQKKQSEELAKKKTDNQKKRDELDKKRKELVHKIGQEQMQIPKGAQVSRDDIDQAMKDLFGGDPIEE